MADTKIQKSDVLAMYFNALNPILGSKVLHRVRIFKK